MRFLQSVVTKLPGPCAWALPLLALCIVLSGPTLYGRHQTPQTQQTTPTGTGLVLGRTVDGDTGLPIAGAIVQVQLPATGRGRETAPGAPAPVQGGQNGPPRLVMMSDSDGWFVFRNLPAGAISFSAELVGYGGGGYNQHQPNGPSEPLTIAEGQQVGDVTLRMWKLGSITGTVTDETGEPMVGTFVRVLNRRMIGGRAVLSLSGGGRSTDDRGVFRAYDLLPGEYVLCVPATAVTVSVAAVQAAAEADVSPGGLILANGVGPSLRTGAGQRVGDLILTTDQPGRGSAVPPAATDAGVLSVYPTLFYNNVTVSARATVVTLKSGEARTNVDFQLPLLTAYKVSGSVSAPDGPAKGMALHLLTADPDEGLSDTAPDDVATSITDPQGQFTFLGVPRGQYVLKAASGPAQRLTQAADGSVSITRSTDATLWASVPVAVEQADLAGLTVALQPGLQVTGRVVFEGVSPQPNEQQLQRGIRLAPTQGAGGRAAGPGINVPVPIGADGTFSSTGYVPGRYSVIAPTWPVLKWSLKSVTLAGADVSDVPVEIAAGDLTNLVVTYTDQPAHLSGTVRDLSGRPDPNALVVVFPVDRHAWGWPNGLHTKSAPASTTGLYTLSTLAPGDYEIAAIPNGWQSTWQTPAMLEQIVASATRVQLKVGETRTEDLKTMTIR
jgi:hypothetical protein